MLEVRVSEATDELDEGAEGPGVQVVAGKRRPLEEEEAQQEAGMWLGALDRGDCPG